MRITKLSLYFLLFAVIVSCKDKHVPAFNKSFSKYIHSFTSGVISKKSSVHIQLVNPADSALIQGSGEGILKFNPEIEGKLIWKNPYSLEFVPNENLIPGEIYVAEFHLGKVTEVPDSLTIFKFGFQVLKPRYEFGSIQLKAQPEDQMNWYRLEVTLISADEDDVESLRDILKADANGKNLNVKWQPSGLRRYTITVDSIQRQEEPVQIKLHVNNDFPGTQNMDDVTITLPALGDFQFMGHDVLMYEDRHVLLKFSDPLDPKQDLKGLISLGSETSLRMEIENTSIRIYPNENMHGTKVLKIYPGIKNIQGYKLQKEYQEEITFHNEKPQVEIIGNGNIIPTGKTLPLNFRAISLNAVDIKVVKIAENNMLQFLQRNSIDGEHELYRVGEIIATEKMNLSSESSLLKWNNYAIDLSKLIEVEPGAVYRVYISFSKDYSLYACEEESGDTRTDEDEEDYYWHYDEYESDYSSDYNYRDYYFNYPKGYRWEQRENPCHVSYYHSNRFDVKNIFATNLGIIVKIGDDKNIHITVCDLTTTKPVSGAKITAFNYQQRKMGETGTDDKGFAVLRTDKKPFFILAEKDGIKSYLKIAEGENQSLSTFDVSGQSIKSGLKGFIYGERGVWRPGDTVFLNFILEDRLKTLPNGHPVRFELSDPNGIVVDRKVSTTTPGRIYNFTTYTIPSAITGNYTATVSVGDNQFTGRIKIETVKPNRLDIKFAAENEILQLTKGMFNTTAEVKWLTGVDAASSKVDVQATLAPINKPFEKYKEYHFSDPVYNFQFNDKDVFEGTTDESGKIEIKGNLGDLGTAPSLLNAKFLIKAFEGGGDFSTEIFQARVAPFSSYVGLKLPETQRGEYLQTNQTYPIKIRTLSKEGKPVSVKKLAVKVYRIDHYWWYNSTSENLANYINNEVTYMISSDTVESINGKATYQLKVDQSQWGRLLIRVCDLENGHCSGLIDYFDWPEGRRSQGENNTGASLLTFKTDKEEYNIDEEITAKIPAAKGSRVLITLENSSGIIHKEWVTADSDVIEFRTKATAVMSPNIYLSAWLIQPHSQTINDRPMRLYGMVPVKVTDPATILYPEIKTLEVWRPESTAEISVSEKNNKEMYYTLAVVDEGLLNLTGFKTPDPWRNFYAKEALGVKTWDIYDNILGAHGGRLEQVFAVGGDGELSRKDLNNQNRFKPMVRQLGPFKLEAGKKAKHKIAVPNYVGSVRIMIVAAGGEKAYGSNDKTVSVRNPLMVLSSLPRMLSPGDEISLPVTVFAMEKQVKDVQLKLKVNGEIDIEGSSERNLTFNKTGQQVIDFKIKVKENIGTAKVRIEAKSGNEKAYSETDLIVRLPNPPIKEVQGFIIKAGEEMTINYKPLGLEGTNTQIIEASTIPPINLNSRLQFLMGYPHGCTEQTISRVFPLLFLDNIMELTDNMKQTRRQNIQIAIQKIFERQMPDGGIGYWPGARAANDYITSYAGNFLILAEKKGYQIPAGVISKWKRFQKNKAKTWQPILSHNGYIYNDFEQAYRLYTLALAGEAEIGAMNRLRETKDISSTALWQLADAYLLAGQKQTAQSLSVKAESLNKEYRGYWYYGSNIRNEAVRLKLLKALGKETEAMEAAREIAKKLNSNNWYSTHSLALALQAVVETFSDHADPGNMKWSITSPTISKNVDTENTIYSLEIDKGVDKAYSYTLKNNSKGVVHFNILKSGIPVTYDVPALSKNLTAEVKYFYPNGKILDIQKIKQGQDFVAEVNISKSGNASGYENMALTQFFPTGWEIINTRLTGMDSDSTSRPEYQDFRDDRVYTYFNMKHKNSATFRIKLNATYAGKYYLPPIVVEDMYNNDIMARFPGVWVEVLRN